MDDFEHEGPSGTHVYLVFELMGETLRSFGVWSRECMVPTTIMRKFSWQLVGSRSTLPTQAASFIHTGKSRPSGGYFLFLRCLLASTPPTYLPLGSQTS